MFWDLFNKKRNESAPNEMNETEEGTVRSVVLSDVGNIRTNNEDMGLFFRVAGEAQRKGYLLVVADGMGGHKAGEVASRMAVEVISHEYYGESGPIDECLKKAFEAANQKIFQKASSSKAHRGMGTTCTAVVVWDNRLFFAHVGDSRGYLIKDGRIHQLTEDHTHVQELIREGLISADAAATHPDRNLLTNAMGTRPMIRIDAGEAPFRFDEGDRLLLCSDGLYEYFSNPELQQVGASGPLAQVARNLIDEAKRRGGHDNITVVLAERTVPVSTPALKQTSDFEWPLTGQNENP